MVCSAVGYALGVVMLIVAVLREVHWGNELDDCKKKYAFLARAAAAESVTLLNDARAAAAESVRRYDALVEKVRVSAAKPDNGIIHASNTAAVRRIFEREVSAQERDKEMEN
jgi:hypothetical protein